MRSATLNNVSGKAILVLSFVALLTVFCGYFTPQQPDEGALAHIFQLSIATLAPILLVFLLTADWEWPLRTVRRLAIPGSVLAAAFVGLYFLERR